MKTELMKQIGAVWEMCGGRTLSKTASDMMITTLEDYTPEQVRVALTRCVKECKGIALSDIISRIDDGWPTADEAWALCPRSETETVVWFLEASQSHAEVRTLDDDRVAQRMAFKDSYRRHVDSAKAEGRRPEWTASLGFDTFSRQGPLVDAVIAGKLTAGEARGLYPDLVLPGDDPAKAHPMLETHRSTSTEPENLGEILKQLPWNKNGEEDQ